MLHLTVVLKNHCMKPCFVCKERKMAFFIFNACILNSNGGIRTALLQAVKDFKNKMNISGQA